MNGQSLRERQNAQNMPPAGQTTVQPKLIGISTPDINDRYLRFLESALRLYAEVNGLEYVLADAQNNVNTQYEQVRRMIESDGVQGLIIIPTDATQMEPITAMARQANIPLVYVNRAPYRMDQIPRNVYYVGSDARDAGIKQGEFLANNLPAGNLAILMGTRGDVGTIGRTAGLEDELVRQGADIQIIAREHANFFRQPAYETTKRWIAQFGNRLNAIAANNDEMALGAIQALQEAGRNDVMVVGVDGLVPGRQAVQQGLMAATVFQDGARQGELAIETIRQLLSGQAPAQQYILVPHILITGGAQGQSTAGS